MQRCNEFQLIWRFSVCGTKLGQNYEWLKFWKSKHQNATFQSIWRTSVFGTKIAKKNMNGKIFEKINVKIKISIYNVPLYQISLNLENFWFCGTKFSQRKYEWQNFEKINIKIEITILLSTSVPNFSQFEELQILRPNLTQ